MVCTKQLLILMVIHRVENTAWEYFNSTAKEYMLGRNTMNHPEIDDIYIHLQGEPKFEAS